MSNGAEEFNVVQFFEDDSYEYVRRSVGIEDAMRACQHYTNSVAVKAGIVVRVIVTDADDCTVFEWKRGQGVTWPIQ